MKDTVKLWVERAEYDLESAKSMLSNGRYLYVAFMCQQAVEKILKGFIQNRTGTLAPYTHNLVLLSEESGLEFSEDQLDFFVVMSGYYINTRYPDVKQKLAQDLNESKSKEILKKSEEVFRWLKNELKI